MHSRFESMPILINECDFSKFAKEEWGGSDFDGAYNSPDGLMLMLDILQIYVDQPDLAYALFKRNIFSNNDNKAIIGLNPNLIIPAGIIRFGFNPIIALLSL